MARLLNAELIQAAATSQSRCAVPDCGRYTMQAAGIGLAQFHCRYHVQYRARHGSLWAPSYLSADLKPYITTASAWIKHHADDPFVVATLSALSSLLDRAGRVDAAQNIKRRSAVYRAKVAFARLREAGVTPRRLAAIHMGVTALIEDDRDSHRVEEFRICQVAKAAHRLASGTHKRWDFPMGDGTTRPIQMHVYPKSSGLVLRAIGMKIEECCGILTRQELETIRRLKRERFGIHPSQSPDWKPRWMLMREEAAKR